MIRRTAYTIPTRRDAYREWRASVLPYLKRAEQRAGITDYPARREAWVNWIDMLVRTGDAPARAAEWAHPSSNEPPATVRGERVYERDGHRYHRCGPCFGRGYRGGGRLPTCRACGGTGEKMIP